MTKHIFLPHLHGFCSTPDSLTSDNRAPLFRRHALDNVRHRFRGEILLARPGSFSAPTSLFALVAICIAAFFGHTRKAQVVGVVTLGTSIARVVAGQAGTIMERRVEEGQAVAAGTMLFVLSSERASDA